jgi:AraC-like DNA-binding protein
MTEAWEAALSGRYRVSCVSKRLPPSFRANVVSRSFSRLDLVETRCDPCRGSYRISELSSDPEPYVAIQLTLAGSETFRVDGRTVDVRAGEMVVWTSDRQAEFEVRDRLHKITLMMPWTLLRERMNERRHAPSSGKLAAADGIGALLAEHLKCLAVQLDTVDRHHLGALGRATLELAGAAVAAARQKPDFQAAMLAHVREYILLHLHDDALSPVRIAQEKRISLRYLYKLFSGDGTSVSRWIQQKRLERSLCLLKDPAYSHHQIAQIAINCGFSSASHFSRAFHALYGVSPSEARASPHEKLPPAPRHASGCDSACTCE